MSYDSAPPPPPGYGQQPMYGGGAPQDHPKATMAMIFGILGLVCCSPFSIPAFIIGNKAVQEIDASGGRLGGRGMANAGKIMGIIGMVIFALSILYVILVVGAGVAGS